MIKFLREKVLVFLIQYTIGLIFPWWLIDLVNRKLIDGYSGQFNSYNKFIRYTIGLILPWWILALLQGNKMQINTDSTESVNNPKSKKEVYYCKYCGIKYNSLSSLTGSLCPRHEMGPHKSRCQPYEGTIKDKYQCKFCGIDSNSINQLTSGICPKHPSGERKHRHQPML